MRSRNDRLRQRSLVIVLALLVSSQAGCSLIMGRVTSGVADSLTVAVLEQDDPELVRDGAPAYLIALDGMIEGDPENVDLLMAGASLYGSYAGAFVDDPKRAAKLATRARRYGERALCVEKKGLCDLSERTFDDFVAALADVNQKDVPVLYSYGSSWAGWIQANSGDWAAIADLPKVQAVMEKVVELEPEVEDGQAYMYLGVLYTLRPASLGGKPEEGREAFERALEISNRRNLFVHVMYADQYARLVFDQELHDALLVEALEADPVEPGLTLINTIAQEQAAELLEDGKDYF
jgi:tetratricopeptide (TPR) repeat protein